MEGRHVSKNPAAEQPPVERERKPSGGAPRLIKNFALDIILTVIVLSVFALFHHVMPRIFQADVIAPAASSVIHPTPSPVQTQEPQAEASPEPVDDRTEWQKKFAEHFTEEIVQTDNSYSSPDVSITINTVTDTERSLVYYVADIYVAQIENFQTYFAGNEMKLYAAEDVFDMSAASGAIICVNGDFCNNQRTGLLVRNGVQYLDEETRNDICVLYSDGTMQTYAPGEYQPADILAASPYQIWKFGPELLDDNGQPKSDYNTTNRIKDKNPRTGVGYYEPGHYCFVVVDGRQYHWSMSVTIQQFAELFADLGCKAAYNLDGGDSSVMVFDGEYFNKPSGKRDLGDILLIREIDSPASDAQQ